VDEVIHDKAKAMKVYAFQARDGELAAIELNGEDLRWAPLEHGKSALTKSLRQKRDGLAGVSPKLTQADAFPPTSR
jgi:hypothetical protein